MLLHGNHFEEIEISEEKDGFYFYCDDRDTGFSFTLSLEEGFRLRDWLNTHDPALYPRKEPADAD